MPRASGFLAAVEGVPVMAGETECCICARVQSRSSLGVWCTWSAAGIQDAANAPCPPRHASPRRGSAERSLATWQEHASSSFFAKDLENPSRRIPNLRQFGIGQDVRRLLAPCNQVAWQRHLERGYFVRKGILEMERLPAEGMHKQLFL